MINERQKILIKYIQNQINNNNWKVKAEYSTNDNDKRVVVVQEVSGNRVVFYEDTTPLFNYYMIDIYGLSIQECKELANLLSYNIGKNILIEDDDYTWQIMFKQLSNPQTVAYQDIRRIGYNMTMQCIINPISEK